MKLLFGRRKAAEGEDDAKHYKKANLGEKNKMYYNSELQMWVEKGKEEEARAAKAALSAPPPPASITPASSTTSLSAAADSTAGQQPAAARYQRGGSIKDRYIAQPVGNVGGGSGPPSGKGLLPGAAASSMVPGLPKIPRPVGGAVMPGAGTFFVPTPATSEAPSELGADSSTPGTMSLSQSGLSMDAFIPGSGPPSQPGMFALDNGKANPHKVGMSADGAQGGATAAGTYAAASATGYEPEGDSRASDRGSSSGGMAPVAASGSQNLSFAAWQRAGSSSSNSPGTAAMHSQQAYQPGAAVDGEVTSPAKQGVQHLGSTLHSQSPNSGLHSHWMPHSVIGSNGNYTGHEAHSNGDLPQTSYMSSAVDPEGGSASVHGLGAEQASAVGVQPASDDQGTSALASSDSVTPAAWTHASTADALRHDTGDESNASGWQQLPSIKPAYVGTTQPPQHGWQDGAWANAGNGVGNVTGSATASAPEYRNHSTEDIGQQQTWGVSDALMQQPQSSEYSNGYQHSANQQWQGYHQQTPADHSWSQQQEYAAANGDYSGLSGSSDPAHQQQLGAYPAYSTGTGLEQVQSYQQPQLLDPVHPELPGIATTLAAKPSEEGPASGGKQYHAASAPAVHAAYADAASRHYSAPGTAPHPSRTTSSGLQNEAWFPSSPSRSNSLQSPTKGSVMSLLPQARPSFNGSTGSPPKDSSALTMPATAVAGDSSLVTTVRPSSPYARPVSPLARTSTCVTDLGMESKTATQGFPIPSPPTAAFGKPGIFVPGDSTKQQGTAQQHMQQVNSIAASFCVANGYVGLHQASIEQQAAGGSGNGGSPLQQQSPVGTQDVARESKSGKRTHFYDKFLHDSLSQVNWKLHPFKQPGKLNRLTPIEEFEMEQERQKQQSQNRLDKVKEDPFYLKQMELRQKLPPAAVKPSISEPVMLPSHVLAGRAVAATSGESATSKASYITDWQQQRQHPRYQQDHTQPVTPPRATGSAAAMYAVDGGSPQEEPTPESKFVPLADAEGGLSPPSAVPFADGMDLEPEAVAAAGGEAQYGNSYGVYTSQPQQEVAEEGGAATGAVEAMAEQAQQEAPAWPTDWSQCTQQQQQEWVQYYYSDYLPWLQDPQYQQWFEQTYNASMQQWQEQQQPAASSEQQQEQHNVGQLQQSECLTAPETAPAGDLPEPTAAMALAAEWGMDSSSQDVAGDSDAVGVPAVPVDTQGLDEQAEVETAADGWTEDAFMLETMIAPADPAACQPGSTKSVSADAEALIAEGADEQAHSHSPRVSSSTVAISQPSTAKAAAAASKAIVSQALGKILQEHAENEAADAHQLETAAAGASAGDIAWGEEWSGVDTAATEAAAAPNGTQQDAAEVTSTAVADAGAWGDGWDGLEVVAEEEQQEGSEAAPGVQDTAVQHSEQSTVGLPKDWQDIRQQVYAIADPDGSLDEYKRCFVGWGDQFFVQAAGLWPIRPSNDDNLAAALLEKTAELEQAAELFSELQLQHRALADIFDSQGFGIEDLLASLEL